MNPKTNTIKIMNTKWILSVGFIVVFTGFAFAQPQKASDTEKPKRKLYMDVHDLGLGKVDFAAVEGAHKKDLATQSEFGVNFIKYWVDEQAGKVYCLAESTSEA